MLWPLFESFLWLYANGHCSRGLYTWSAIYVYIYIYDIYYNVSTATIRNFGKLCTTNHHHLCSECMASTIAIIIVMSKLRHG